MALTEKGMEIARTLADMPEVQAAAKEPAFALTQNNYGHYAQAIQAIGNACAKDTKTGHYLAAEALKMAGGNKAGIDSAMFAMFGYADFDPMTRMFA